MEKESPKEKPRKIYVGKEFESIIYRHEDQVKLLQGMTQIDLRLFFGFLTAQFLFGSFIVTNQFEIGFIERIGLFMIDVVFAIIIIDLLQRSYIRRLETIETLKNCNLALGYEENDTYLKGKTINAKTKIHPWFKGMGYKTGIIVAILGIIIILFIPFFIDFIQNGDFSLYLEAKEPIQKVNYIRNFDKLYLIEQTELK